MFVPLQSYWDVHHKGEETAAENREVTAIMVRPKGIADFYQLNQEINRGAMAQAVASGAGLTQLFDLLGEGKTILSMVSYLALVMASATVFLASYAVGAQRRRETAILRALGAGRWLVSGLALLESLALAAGGAVLGLALGHAVAWAIASRIQESSALAVRPGFLPSEALVVAAILVLALAAGAIPALQSYRQDVAASLAPT
jgi:putative ABC transport system permease protein